MEDNQMEDKSVKTNKQFCEKVHLMQLKTVNGVSMVVCSVCGYSYPSFPHKANVELTSSKVTL